MQQIISFLRRSKYFFWFLLLQLIAFFLIGQKNYYHRNVFLHNSNEITGFIAKKASKMHDYFQLDSINDALLIENSSLRNELEHYKNSSSPRVEDTNFNYISAAVVINNYRLQQNFITIDKGAKDGISKEMAVVSDKGIVGQVIAVSAHYAQVISVLHLDFRVNAAIKKNNHFGILKWDGVSFKTMQLLDIPRLAKVAKGDTIVTGGNSKIFPKGSPIGIVDKIGVESGDNYYSIDVNLFQDMSNLNFVYVVKNKTIDELNDLINN